jgi:acetyltransferase
MTVRNLDALLAPKHVALIGASARPHSVGAVTAENLRGAGFGGTLMLVNPKHRAIGDAPCYPDIGALPQTPDLAVICTPPQTVPSLIADLGRRGTRAAVVISAGFGEGGNAGGRGLQQAMLDAARPHLLRIVGPNCLGVISTPARLNASFAQTMPRPGRIAFVAQSGAMVTTMLDWAGGRGIGFSHLVSLGDMADVDFGDMLDYLATDENTSAILLYIEAITEARKFMSAARAASRLKPVIAIKAGRQAAAAKAATSHTGALAGIDAVYDAAFQRAGILRVYSLDELFDAVETLALAPGIKGERLTIVTNGGGLGVLALDALLAEGGHPADLSDAAKAALDKVLPPTWSKGNPVDIIGDADGRRYAMAIETLAGEPGQDAILAINCPTAVSSSVEAAAAVASAAAKTRVPLIASWVGSATSGESRAIFNAARIAAYDTPEKAVRGFMHVVRHRRAQLSLLEVPPAAPHGPDADTARARAIVTRAVADGQSWLDPITVQDIFAYYRIPLVRSIEAATPRDAGAAAAGLTPPFALKILSPDIPHKSDAGGVVLDLADAGAVETAAAQMLERVRQRRPDAAISGFILQEMVHRHGAFELILGSAVDRSFGPFLLFGQGGTAAEVINDKALALPPLNMKLARETVARTRIYRQLQGYRDRAPVAHDAVEEVLVRLSQLVCDLPEVAELDINPLLADATGVIAVDARIRVVPGQTDRLAIRPYPAELERSESIGGRSYSLRAVKPEDAELFERFFARLSPEDIRLRFFSTLHALPQQMLARFTQIDYAREMAFVLIDAEGALAAVARMVADPDLTKAEFAVLVRSDLKRQGIARRLMERLGGYARDRGIGELFGLVLSDNQAMLSLCRSLGCRLEANLAGTVRASLAIAG